MKRRALLILATTATAIGIAYSGALAAKPAEPLTSTTDLMAQPRQEPLQVARYYGGHHHHGHGNAVGAAVVGALIGGVIANEMYRRPTYPTQRTYRTYRTYRVEDGYQAAKNRCANEYRSYDWNTDTFVAYGGEERLCRHVLPWH